MLSQAYAAMTERPNRSHALGFRSNQSIANNVQLTERSQSYRRSSRATSSFTSINIPKRNIHHANLYSSSWLASPGLATLRIVAIQTGGSISLQCLCLVIKLGLYCSVPTKLLYYNCSIILLRRYRPVMLHSYSASYHHPPSCRHPLG